MGERLSGCDAVCKVDVESSERIAPICMGGSELGASQQTIIGCSHADLCISSLKKKVDVHNVLIRDPDDPQRIRAHYEVPDVGLKSTQL